MPNPINHLRLCAPTHAPSFEAPHLRPMHVDPELTSLCKTAQWVHPETITAHHLAPPPSTTPTTAYRAVLSQPVLAAEIPAEHALQFGEELADEHAINGAPGPLEVLEYALWESLPFIKVPQFIRAPIAKGITNLRQLDLGTAYVRAFDKTLKKVGGGLAAAHKTEMESSLASRGVKTPKAAQQEIKSLLNEAEKLRKKSEPLTIHAKQLSNQTWPSATETGQAWKAVEHVQQQRNAALDQVNKLRFEFDLWR